MEYNKPLLQTLIHLFEYYESLGKKTVDQLPDEGLFWKYNEESNSIAVIVKHLHGNMLSRWTDLLTTDGEKEWRHRDNEFTDSIRTRKELLEKYDHGWKTLFGTLASLSDDDLNRIIYIRNMGHTVLEAIHRQIAHYAYHIGQIVVLGKQIQNEKWQTLSIARNASKKYNEEKFSKDKTEKHFTDDL